MRAISANASESRWHIHRDAFLNADKWLDQPAVIPIARTFAPPRIPVGQLCLGRLEYSGKAGVELIDCLAPGYRTPRAMSDFACAITWRRGRVGVMAGTAPRSPTEAPPSFLDHRRRRPGPRIVERVPSLQRHLAYVQGRPVVVFSSSISASQAFPSHSSGLDPSPRAYL
jgi:hypothetical protein